MQFLRFLESYARVDACWAERACRAGCAGQYARADLDSLSAGDLEPDVATRPAAIAAAAAAAEQQRQQQQRIPPARSRRGHVAHQKKHREEAVLTCRPAQCQHQPQAKLQHVDWNTLLRHICNARSRWTMSSRRAVFWGVVTQKSYLILSVVTCQWQEWHRRYLISIDRVRLLHVIHLTCVCCGFLRVPR